MANAKTGIWSAIGAVVGGAAGAAAGHYAAKARPIHRYANAPRGRDVEDAMVVGGAIGAVTGAFFAGTVAGEDEPPPAPTRPQLVIP